jgi:hypothetical protein
MDRFLDAAYHKWHYGVLYPAVSHRSATEQALEMVGVAYGRLLSWWVFYWVRSLLER